MRKVIILGSGGLSVGQAGEFDYSGSQAIKALKEEGIKTVLINPNIATIQTSKDLADEVYFLPVTPAFVTRVIEKEKPDGILLSFGGQTALNCGMELADAGVFEKYDVKVLGTPIETIKKTEDRDLFKTILNQINIPSPKSIAAHSVEDALQAVKEIGFPVIVRAAFALGGLGSGFCSNEEELLTLVNKAFALSSQVLVEESLKGWKEIEYEVMRDANDNCMTVCNMENFDPLGIHTGESIVVAPSQTLTDREYQLLRKVSIDVIRHLGVIGECNIQFALHPNKEIYRVIEVNARLSRSSALASKATGYPLAFIAAKVILGKSLPEIPNPVTQVTKAFFEPALDYLVVKFPRWDLEKFLQVDKRIGSQMKSVGEVMSIGRTFEEALQKAVRMVNPAYDGVTHEVDCKDIEAELSEPTDKRVFAIAKAYKQGYTTDQIHEKTRIDKWFLEKIRHIVEIEKQLETQILDSLDPGLVKSAKVYGFSDKRIAKVCKSNELAVRNLRKQYNIIPVIKQIDTLAAEYPCVTNYLYLTYNGTQDDITIEKKGVIVLGGGAYRIGSSVEFDWCCVEAVKTIRKEKIPSIMINYNPETVSTDFDECDRLYFDELSFERVLDICEKENPKGVVVSMGGQIPNNLALPLFKANVPILGTSPETIDSVEDRHKFSKTLDALGVDQPAWKELTNAQDLANFANGVGYPVLIRPSYVLSGSAMNVAYNEKDLHTFLKEAADVSQEHPVVVTKFITGAKEIDVDIVAQDGEIKAYAISEHVENAGVHSGDATLVTPPQKLYVETVRRIKRISKQLVKHLDVTGPLNIQFLAKDNMIKIIECNLRASRSFPFVSKVYDMSFIDLATQAILKKRIDQRESKLFDLPYLGVKAPQFSFTRLHGADPVLGVEMASTGEVACLATTLHDAFLKSLIATRFALPKKSFLISSGTVQEKAKLLNSIRLLQKAGYELYATKGTALFYEKHGITMNVLNRPSQPGNPGAIEYIRDGKIDCIINIPKNNENNELQDGYRIRRAAVDFSVPLITNLQCSILFIEAICNLSEDDLSIKSWNEYTV